MAKSSGKGNWVTINGTHVLIDGNKKIISGPKNLIGMTPRQAIGLDPVDSKSDKPSASKSPASKAMAKAKSDREADPSKKKKADGLVERAKRQQASTTLDSIFDSATSTTGTKSSTEQKKGFITRTDKADVTYGSLDRIVNTSGVVTSKDLPDLRSLPKGSVQLIIQNNSSHLEQPTFAVKVGDTIMRATPKVAAAMFPDKIRGMTKAMDDLADRFSKGKAATGNSNFDNATGTTKVKVVKNPNNRLHTGRESSNGLNPKQEKLFNQYVKQGYSGNEAYKIATTGRVPSVQSSGGAVAPTSRQSNPATISNAKTMGEFLHAAHAPATARKKRGRNK